MGACGGMTPILFDLEMLYNRHMSSAPLPYLVKLAGNADENDGDAGAVTPHTNIAIKPKPETKKPSMYKVLLLNDDYTPMEFVVHVLERFFNKSQTEATQIMLHVHRKGVGLCGVFTFEIAETKVAQVMDFARRNQHPLQCTMERE